MFSRGEVAETHFATAVGLDGPRRGWGGAQAALWLGGNLGVAPLPDHVGMTPSTYFLSHARRNRPIGLGGPVRPTTAEYSALWPEPAGTGLAAAAGAGSGDAWRWRRAAPWRVAAGAPAARPVSSGPASGTVEGGPQALGHGALLARGFPGADPGWHSAQVPQ